MVRVRLAPDGALIAVGMASEVPRAEAGGLVVVKEGFGWEERLEVELRNC